MGRMILPYLLNVHDITIFDLVPPSSPAVRFVQGSALDVEDLERGARGC